ncbi:hypothetical protein ID866_9544 [Astraeus odoratus]|nr:hypothetical protein ID866_9544 [Astraeus odoratus]
MMECAESRGEVIKTRQTQPLGVAIVDLPLASELNESPTLSQPLAPYYASAPILTSLGTCAAAGWYQDWFSFFMILLGTVVSGVSCLVIGSGEFLFTHPEPAIGSPPGDGILSSEEGIILLRREEGAVNAVTRGRFSLLFKSRDASRNIRLCSIFLVMQSIAQLILIPQSSLFGQLMFVASLAVSWAYNLWLGSFDNKKVQREILLKVLSKPKITKFVLGTRTSTAVFTLLVLNLTNPEHLMDVLLPSNTRVWNKWKATIINKLKNHCELEFDSSNWDGTTFSDSEKSLLKTFFKDAQEAYEGFKLYDGEI